ncbi:hypothetical protein AUP45_03950 [Thalassospira xiamenensis]|nr:hypothetical protein AUP45_03950 [Thalassospira xiamenensis]
MITRNVVGGAIATLVGLIYIYFAMQIRVSALSDSFGPRGLPIVYGILISGLGVLLVLQSIFELARKSQEERKSFLEEEWKGTGFRMARAAGLLAIAVLFLLVVNYLGYAVSIALVIAAVSIYMGAAPSIRLFLIAVGGATLMWLIFVWLLGVRMPTGIFASLGF